VVFVSADRSAQSFQEYHKEMPFPAVPFAGGKELRSGLWCAWNSSARRARRSRAGRALRCLYRRTLPGRTARCCRVPVVFGAREGPEERGKVQGRRDQSVEGWRRGRLLPICRRQRRLAGAHARRSSVGVGCSPSCTLVRPRHRRRVFLWSVVRPQSLHGCLFEVPLWPLPVASAAFRTAAHLSGRFALQLIGAGRAGASPHS